MGSCKGAAARPPPGWYSCYCCYCLIPCRALKGKVPAKALSRNCGLGIARRVEAQGPSLPRIAARMPPHGSLPFKTSTDFRLPIINLASACSSVNPSVGNHFVAIRIYSRNRRDGVPQSFRSELFATTQLAEVPHATNVPIGEKTDWREAALAGSLI